MVDMPQKLKKVKGIPFLEGFVFPLLSISKNLKGFLSLTGGVSVIISLISVLSGCSFLCNFDFNKGFCAPRTVGWFVSSFLLWFVGAVFLVNRWQMVAFEGKSIKEAFKAWFGKKDLKAALIVLLFLMLWLITGIGIYGLNVRVPVEDWRVELLFFVGVSIVIFLSMLLLLNFVVFQHFLQGGKFLALNKTFLPVFDNVGKFIIWFFVYFLILIYVLLFFLRYFFVGSLPVWLNIFGCDFAFYFVMYSAEILLLSSLYYQERILFAEEE